MDHDSIDTRSRRSVLRRAVWLAGVATIPLLAGTRSAFADGKLAKADVRYQDKPNAGKDCDDCLQFIPGATPGANGSCKVVEGVISPHGYCDAFARRPKRD
jgi:hypothetical protein